MLSRLLAGSCASCSSSAITVKMGIERTRRFSGFYLASGPLHCDACVCLVLWVEIRNYQTKCDAACISVEYAVVWIAVCVRCLALGAGKSTESVSSRTMLDRFPEIYEVEAPPRAYPHLSRPRTKRYKSRTSQSCALRSKLLKRG